MDPLDVRIYFENRKVVDEYADAAVNVGLWNSERIVVEKFVSKDARILELGCGAGRIAMGLEKIGYKSIVSTDFSESMVEKARALYADAGTSGTQSRSVKFEVADACDLSRFAPETFDAAIFGFNGFMQIPSQKRRLAACGEIHRILAPRGIFIFTTHDRRKKENARYWEHEADLWCRNAQNPNLDEFGDIIYRTEHGSVFIHSPVDEETEETLSQAGFKCLLRKKRSEIASESAACMAFSDECIFWVFEKTEKPAILKKSEHEKNIHTSCGDTACRNSGSRKHA